MLRSLKFIVMGYLCGSVLFARICAKLFNKPEILLESKDKNPGAANAFQYGGFLCGILTLGGDLAKGFLPIFSFLRSGENFEAPSLLAAMVLAAPVLGHVFPVFFRFQGGKGISVTFGCLLGAFPNCKPLLIFALVFVAFSTVLRITPHHRTADHSAFYPHDRNLCCCAVRDGGAALFAGHPIGICHDSGDRTYAHAYA